MEGVIIVVIILAIFGGIILKVFRTTKNVAGNVAGVARKVSTLTSDSIKCKSCSAVLPTKFQITCDKCGFTKTRNIASACPNCNFKAGFAACPECGESVKFA